MKNILASFVAFFALDRISKMITEPLAQVPKDWRYVRYAIAGCVILMVTMSALEYSARCLESIVRHWPF